VKDLMTGKSQMATFVQSSFEQMDLNILPSVLEDNEFNTILISFSYMPPSSFLAVKNKKWSNTNLPLFALVF
jgi:hypothetical protein